MGEKGSMENIFEIAIKTHKENKEMNEKKQKEQAERALREKQQEIKKRTTDVQKHNPEESNFSDELYDYIQEFGFVIESYEKHEENIGKDSYFEDNPIEVYYCSYGAWQFTVKHYEDIDIPEGIFSLTDIVHKETLEPVSFYCDLGCRNTQEERRDILLDFLTYPTLEMYIQDGYGKYFRLPDLLRKKGFNVIENDFSFDLYETKGYLTVDENVYVKVFRGWYEDLKLVVTNDPYWNSNSSNDDWGGDKAYYFDFYSVDCIDELVKCIAAFKDDQDGKIGYFENGHYYSNMDVHAFYQSLRKKEEYYSDAWNHYHIRLDHINEWDERGYGEERSTVLNKYKGLELFVKTELSFNDAAQWSKGDWKNKSLITFEYDRRKSEKCRLLIQNYVYENSLTYYDEELEEQLTDETKLVGSIEQEGSFLELLDVLKVYIYTMAEIHEITL